MAEYEVADAERELLTEACRALDRADEAGAAIAAAGLMTVDRYGCPKVHPAVDVEARARTQFAAIVRQLGVKLPDVESPRTRQAKRAANARWSTHGRSA
jgi:phage terminase small subunit